MTDHDRVITSGAWAGAFAVTLGMVWLTSKVPYVVAWLLNSAVCCGVSYAMARWKRRWYAWLSFYGIALVCVLNGILKAFTPLLDNPWSGANIIIAWLLVGSWYWLVRIPKLHPPAMPNVTHVVHHHVVHGPDGQAVGLGQWDTELPGAVSGELYGTERPSAGERVPLALENLAVRPGAFIGRRGELLARLRQAKGSEPWKRS